MWDRVERFRKIQKYNICRKPTVSIVSPIMEDCEKLRQTGFALHESKLIRNKNVLSYPKFL